MAVPTDGFGLYEGVNTSLGQSTWGPRLDAIAAGGFKLVMNYALSKGHIADVIAYINYAQSVGVKVIVSLEDVRIWRDNTYPTIYPQLYADSGNAATGTLFAQYIVNQVKGLPGVWGYYVGDEPVAADHATWSPYAAAIHTADATHPRLVIESATPGASNFYQGSTLYYDQCEVGGDDYYPIGNTNVSWAPIATVASGVQSFCTSKGIGSAMVFQLQSWQLYYPPARCVGYPLCAPYPAYVDIAQVINGMLANMTPRLILGYNYADILRSDNPTQHWNDVVAALANLNNPKAASFVVHS